jgi:BA14K-like protein
MRRIAPIAAVVLTLTVCGAGAPAVAFEKHQNTITDPNLIPPPFTAPEPYTPPGVIGRGERLEMRSYLPYSGLQKGFRPPPPMQHGVVTDRPEIVQPIPLAPLMDTPTPFSAQWYAYCAERYRSFEPSTGTYTTYGGVTRRCR